ncbi:MAG: hypothetical protein Q8L88_14445 [Bacteroidota bacterium]|nr:hypothetical protein [Bacteroidota bacterium]
MKKTNSNIVKLYFSDFFDISSAKLDRYGAFNISLITDLPLFIDPFLLFNSRKRIYQKLHKQIIEYLQFLRDKSVGQQLDSGLLSSWYYFSEVEQNWLGFSALGNKGRGLGKEFAVALNSNLKNLFPDFGHEKITQSSHLEKLCLIKDKVGKDTISDFTTNLIKDFLLEFTQTFARKFLKPNQRKRFSISKAKFNYKTESWETKSYSLPFYNNDFIILSPKDLLTKDDTWINKHDLIADFFNIPNAIPNEQLRAQINNYFKSILPKKPKKKDEDFAKRRVFLQFPQLIDYFIKYKEENGQEAYNRSIKYVFESKQLYVEQFGKLIELLKDNSDFYNITVSTSHDVKNRLLYLKDVIENKGGHRIFYLNGKPVSNEEDLQILYRLTWYSTSSSVTREANDGRGPVDFKVSKGSKDTTLVEMKLASNSQLKRNLEKQTAIYQKASDAKTVYKVILFFSASEERKIEKILNQLKIQNDKRIILIDARKDNKPSGSKA